MNLYWKIKLSLFEELEKECLDTGSYLKLLCDFGLKNNDCSPKRCHKCASKKFYTKDLDFMEGFGVCEYESFCEKCHTCNGYWSYGHWMP